MRSRHIKGQGDCFQSGIWEKEEMSTNRPIDQQRKRKY